MQAQIECDICFAEFDPTNHIPKILHCGHSLCILCYTKIYENSNQVTCHKCMKTFIESPKNAITNYGLLEACTSTKKPQEECSLHQLPTIFFCFDHGQLICHGCTLGDHCPPCHVKDSRNAYKEMLPKYSDLFEKVCQEQNKLISIQSEVYKTIQDASEQLQTFTQAVDQQAEQMIQFIKQQKQKVQKQAKDMVQNHMHRFTTDLQRLSNLIGNLQEVQEMQQEQQKQDLKSLLMRIQKAQKFLAEANKEMFEVPQFEVELKLVDNNVLEKIGQV